MASETATPAAESKVSGGTGGGLFRPFTASEGMWAAINESSSPLCLLVRVSGPLAADTLRLALAHVRAEHPYLRCAVHKERGGVGDSPLAEIPLTTETVAAAPSDAHALRALVRAQLLAGVTITDTFVRVHLVKHSGAGGEGVSHLLLIGDHMCFDGRSFFSWLGSLMAALGTVASDPAATFDGEPHEFLNWSTQVPDVALERYVKPESVALFSNTIAIAKAERSGDGDDESKAAAGTDAPASTKVEDVVLTVPSEVFAKLKATSKAVGAKLNGPLAVAFNCALADLARKRADELPVTTLSACAVDVRGMLTPPMSPAYVSSVAGMANVPCEVSDGMDMWSAGNKFTEQLVAKMKAGEPFRMAKMLTGQDVGNIADIFAISCVWSNIGHYPGPATVGPYTVEHMESHVMGDGAANPLFSAHLVEVGGNLAVSLTYSPVFHDRGLMATLLDRFLVHVQAMADSPTAAYH